MAHRAGETAISKQGRNREGQAGSSRLNGILTLLILGVLVFVGVKIVPVYITNYQFHDAMLAEARFALSSYPKKSDTDVQDDLYKEATKDGIDIKHDDIKVLINGSLVTITLDYAVPIDLKAYQFTLHFHCLADNHTI